MKQISLGLAHKKLSCVALVATEHLGQIEFRETGSKYEPTGKLEPSFLWSRNNQMLIDKARRLRLFKITIGLESWSNALRGPATVPTLDNINLCSLFKKSRIPYPVCGFLSD